MNTRKQYKFYFVCVGLSVCLTLILTTFINVLLGNSVLSSLPLTILSLISVAGTCFCLTKFMIALNARQEFKKIFGHYPEKLYHHDVNEHFTHLVEQCYEKTGGPEWLAYKIALCKSLELAREFGFFIHTENKINEILRTEISA